MACVYYQYEQSPRIKVAGTLYHAQVSQKIAGSTQPEGAHRVPEFVAHKKKLKGDVQAVPRDTKGSCGRAELTPWQCWPEWVFAELRSLLCAARIPSLGSPSSRLKPAFQSHKEPQNVHCAYSGSFYLSKIINKN